MVYIVIGVSSSGKTLIGTKLAARLSLPFFDGDDFHPPQNVDKMKKGQPLNDQDRRPWLQILQQLILEQEQKDGCVLACSALKKSYRNILAPSKKIVQFIFLKGTKSLIARRMENRKGHFMPPKLLDSQFKALEKPAEAITVDVNQTVDAIIKEIIGQLKISQK